MAAVKLTTEQRFWSKVRKTDSCWLWTACVNACGYGSFHPEKGNCLAHRFAWQITNGPIPNGLNVLHRCDTPACVKTDHLFLGNHRDNMRDCARKGRFPDRRGELHPYVKLTETDVIAIRTDTRSNYAIAKSYGRASGCIWNIKQRRTWKHLP